MKIWLKMILGGIAGMFLGLYLPDAAGDACRFLAGLAVRIGRYTLLPLILFGLIITAYELRTERKLFVVYRKTIVYAVLTSLGMIILGIIFVSLFTPGRIPIIIETQIPLDKPDIGNLLYQVFPSNLFALFAASTDFSLPVMVFALLFGLALTHDKNLFRSVVEFSDSLSHVFYHINSFISEFLFIGGIALAASMVLQLRKVTELSLFLELFLVLGMFSLVIAFGIFPLILYFLRGRKKPFVWMYAQLAPAVGAFLSGDVYFSLGLLIRHGKEVLGVPRKISAVSYPFLAIFTRGGSAMITAMSFIVILRSYSSLEIGYLHVLWIIAASFGISFLLGSVPGMGSLVGIAMLSGMYGRGMEEHFLILRPVSLILISLGALLDTVCASFVTTLVTNSTRLSGEIKDAKTSELI
ncbi:MAG: cation:dicarboxylase symporter family transporter [Spirochaetales bacterium]|jgi:Na+/H+-dicarboxylate symporter|nr:cation:dicarboxylase symporter family transporter [Spirochaetales bacterium]